MFLPEDIKKLAKLANLPIEEEKFAEFSDQLSEILDYIKKLERVESQGVTPTFNVTGLFNLTRADEEWSSLSQEKALQNAPSKKDGFFLIKGILNNE